MLHYTTTAPQKQIPHTNREHSGWVRDDSVRQANSRFLGGSDENVGTPRNDKPFNRRESVKVWVLRWVGTGEACASPGRPKGRPYKATNAKTPFFANDAQDEAPAGTTTSKAADFAQVAKSALHDDNARQKLKTPPFANDAQDGPPGKEKPADSP